MFKVNDIVEAWGCVGKVIEIKQDSERPVCVELGDKERVSAFYRDGKDQTWHKKPTLQLIERPKVKTEITVWGRVSHSGWVIQTHDTLNGAKEYFNSDYHRAIVKLTGTYEV